MDRVNDSTAKLSGIDIQSPSMLEGSLGTPREAAGTHVWWGVVFITLAYIALLFYTKPLNWGDSHVYARNVVNFSAGLLNPRQFWEFGHLFWRPVGYLVWHLGNPYWSRQFGGNQILEAYAALQLPNILLGYVAALASFGITWKVSRSVSTASLVCVSFLGWNPFLNYFQSGTSYVPGLAFQLAGLYFLLEVDGQRRPLWHAWLSGALLAVSVCLWLPYVFGIPGILLLAYLWGGIDSGSDSRMRLRRLAHSVIVCAIVGSLLYGVGASLAGMRSAPDLRAWVADAGHGIQPDRTYLRVATGLPRSLLETDRDGFLLKRFVLKDPYNPVSLLEIIRRNIWKLILFYVGVASLVWTLARDPMARPVAWPFFLSTGLVLFLAIVLFEPSMPERWMPIFAVLIPALAFVFRSRQTLRSSSIVLAVVLAVSWVNNVTAYAAPGVPDSGNPTVIRILALRPVMTPKGIVALVSLNDAAATLFSRYPFHPLGPVREHFFFLTEGGRTNNGRWRHDFANRALRVWQEDGDVWISKRALADRPLADWGWIEGDDHNVHWRDFPSFFTAFTFDGDVGGPDGFVRIARSPANESVLISAAKDITSAH